tara:strand:- start:315 stop:539 length:225 start_codon:yes stop_codon:yes gene_type:complete
MTRSQELDAWLDHWSSAIDDWERETGKRLLGIATNKRGLIERWADRHNHKMAFIRTIMSTLAAIASLAVLYKVW